MSVPLMVNAFDPRNSAGLDPLLKSLIARRNRVLGPSYKLFYDHPLHVVRGEGVWLYDAVGDRYLDAYNNVPAVGHCHPHVVEAVSRQLATLNTHTRYLYDIVLTYAERLVAGFPKKLANVMFTCTGSEASDLAMRIARTHTGGTGIVVTENAYHGLTAAIAEISPSLGAGVPLAAHVRTVPAPDGYRSEAGNLSEIFARSVDQAFQDLRRHGVKPAAMIVDTIFSSDGVFSDPPGFLAKAVEVTHREGALFVADEVQPGFARTGEAMWGFQRHGIVPDLVVMGKPMGNGLPIGGVAADPAVLTEFARVARYFNTFGGNPVCCAAALAVLEVIEREALMANALAVGTYLRKGLETLAVRYPIIGNVRGAGLFIGVDIVKDAKTKEPWPDCALRAVNELRKRHILISASSPLGNVLKIRPPLPFSRQNAELLLDALQDVFAHMECSS